MDFEHGRNTVVQTEKGKLRGFRHNGVYHFYGIEYAKAKRSEERRVGKECRL